ncbi:MAG: hypothetical protein WC231_01180 [Dehalococcoidales bacterium]
MEQYISLILNAILGGGFITTVVMLRSQRRQAMAVAGASEIENVQKVAQIWRESLEERERYFKTEMEVLHEKIAGMQTTVRSLQSTNRQILKILKEINHDNLVQKKEEAERLAVG